LGKKYWGGRKASGAEKSRVIIILGKVGRLKKPVFQTAFVEQRELGNATLKYLGGGVGKKTGRCQEKNKDCAIPKGT